MSSNALELSSKPASLRCVFIDSEEPFLQSSQLISDQCYIEPNGEYVLIKPPRGQSLSNSKTYRLSIYFSNTNQLFFTLPVHSRCQFILSVED